MKGYSDVVMGQSLEAESRHKLASGLQTSPNRILRALGLGCCFPRAALTRTDSVLTRTDSIMSDTDFVTMSPSTSQTQS